MSEPIATTKLGQLKGLISDNSNGEKVYYFLGIPYAKPPVEDLRFKAPQPLEPWEGIKDCTQEGEPCYSLNFLIKQPVGSEDCLVLNVMTKELGNSKSPKPVMVFIHGGGYTSGSSNLAMTGPKYLLNEDIVLVTLNYRLGALGFLSLDDPTLDVPGNAGLKDQVMALRWVQQNISAFNGDPDNVTIFGVSAGGSSVQFLTLSPLAKGLFHKAIMQSGSVFNPWPWGNKNGVEVANLFQKDVKTEREALEVLIKVPVEELFDKSANLIDDNILDTYKKRAFGPVIEYPNPGAFLSENPIDIITSGRLNDVPTIQGLTSNEGLVMEMVKSMLKPLEGDVVDYNIPWPLNLKRGTPEYEETKRKVQEFYFKDGVTKETTYELSGDVLFVLGTIQSLRLLVEHSKQPLYSYVLSWEVEATNFIKNMFGVTSKGVCHGGDQLLLFSTALVEKLTGESLVASNMVVKLWTNFARTGIPSTHDIKWDPITSSSELNYLDILEKPQMKINPFAKSIAFWDGISKNSIKNKL